MLVARLDLTRGGGHTDTTIPSLRAGQSRKRRKKSVSFNVRRFVYVDINLVCTYLGAAIAGPRGRGGHWGCMDR